MACARDSRIRIYISVDMEGISGVTRWQDVVTDGQDYERARRWMTRDVNAAVEGARAAGATDFVVEENHGVEMLCNLLLDEIDPDVDVVRGIPRPGATTAAALDGTVDALFLVGHHAKVGDFPGFCAHTISYEQYKDVRLDGRTISEGEIFATIAAQAGVPTALIAGDDVVCAELSKIVPGIECAEVKQAYSRTAGRIIPPARAHGIIRDAASRAVERLSAGTVATIDVEPPFRLEVELQLPVTDEVATMIADHHPEFELRGDRILAFEHDEMAMAYRMAAIVGLLSQRGRVNHY